MKVPEKIKKAIRNCAEYNNRAMLEEREIIRWMELHKLTDDTYTDIERNMTDAFIDYCQLGYDPQAFIEMLENL